MQLVRGGSDRRLQNAALLEVLPLLAGSKLMSARTLRSLRAAYLLLRKAENAVQMIRDQQTHGLPADTDRPRAARPAVGITRLGRRARAHRWRAPHGGRRSLPRCCSARPDPQSAERRSSLGLVRRRAGRHRGGTRQPGLSELPSLRGSRRIACRPIAARPRTAGWMRPGAAACTSFWTGC